MFARRGFASEHFKNIYSLPHFACACGPRRNAEKIGQSVQLTSDHSGRQRCGPTEKQRETASRLKEILFLPPVMITQKIAVIGEKTDLNVVRIRPLFDCIKDSAKAMIQVSDLAVISGLHNFGQLWIDGIGPDGISHVRDLFIQLIFFQLAKNQLWHSIRIVHPVKRNRWRQRRMRPDKRYEAEKRTGII